MKRIEFEDALVVEPAKVSVLDEMPVGSVIDYDGDEVPAGWEKVAGSDNQITNLKFTEIMVSCEKDSLNNIIDYSSVPGTIICSFLIGGQSTVGNNNQTSIVPTYIDDDMNKNKVYAINYSSNNGAGIVHIGVFYTN